MAGNHTERREPSTLPIERQVLALLGGADRRPVEVVETARLGLVERRRFGRLVSGRLSRQATLDAIDWARRQLDHHMADAAAWRGPSRRDVERRRAVNASWLSGAFEAAEELATRETMTMEDLAHLNRMVGRTGELRKGSIRVDGFPVQITADAAPIATEAHLAASTEPNGPPALRAARLHLGILLAHPFRDGNGRTARAAAGSVLLRGGMRSSLLTCVEHHHHLRPSSYRWALAAYRRETVGIEWVLDQFLAAMAGRCVPAAWVRARSRAVLRFAADVSPESAVELALAYDRGDPAPGMEHVTLEPWWRLQPHIHPIIRRELTSQIGRAITDGG